MTLQVVLSMENMLMAQSNHIIDYFPIIAHPGVLYSLHICLIIFPKYKSLTDYHNGRLNIQS